MIAIEIEQPEPSLFQPARAVKAKVPVAEEFRNAVLVGDAADGIVCFEY